MEFDATGKMKEPDCDMTLEQFEELQRKIQEELEERIAETRRSLEDDDDDEEESEDDGDDADADGGSYAKDKDKSEIEIRVFVSELIPIRVLLDEETGIIDLRNLEIYDIEILGSDDGDDDVPDPDPEKIYYVWSCTGDNPCEVCEEMDGTILDDDHVPKPHPNCNCEAVRMPGSEYKKKYGKPSTKKQKKYEELKAKEKEWKEMAMEKELKNDKNFETAVAKTFGPEGGYTDGKDQVDDQPTKMGIQQGTLDRYNKEFPDKNFPENVNDLQRTQAKEIYKDYYWDRTNIPKIENDRIRNTVFDMNVMGGAGKTVQNALNSYADIGLKVDGSIGNKTINAINSISENKVSGFMETLKEERKEYLRGTPNWPTAQNGWIKRTDAY